ncbi:MAG: protein kinase, partial [Acidobacteriaceae bacterium]|nr:protein kinase [Acidobacteriaceae bacterium]
HHDPPFSPGAQIGDYQVVSFLGAGAMGRVYRARDKRLHRDVALKILSEDCCTDPEQLRRFEREARTAAALNHPNILTVFYTGTDGGVHYIVSEIVDGIRLRERIGSLTLDEAINYASQVACALEAAHSVGIVHRDIKPENIMIRSDGLIKVLDFGLAKLIHPPVLSNGAPGNLPASLNSTPGLLIGTVEYMSPEQVRGEAVDLRTDIWSWGVLLYEMLSGRRPFEGGSRAAILASILTCEPARLNIESALARVVARSLEKRPDDRYCKISDARHDLLNCCETLSRNPRKTAAASDAPRKERRLAFLDSGRASASFAVSGEPADTKRRRPYLRAVFVIGLIGVLVSATAASIWHLRHKLTLPEQKRLAVLPFKSGPTCQPLTREITDALTRDLKRLEVSERSLRVVPASEVAKVPALPPKNTAEWLGANLILAGEVRRQAQTFVVHSVLQDPYTARELVSGKLERPETQQFLLEDDLFRQVSQWLQPQVARQTSPHLASDEVIAPGAYEIYLQSKDYLRRGTAENIDHSIRLLKLCIERDARFAPAYANLALALALKFRMTKNMEFRKDAEAECRRALALDSNMASAHLTLGMLQEDTGNLDYAVRELETALQLDPTDESTLNHLAQVYEKSGNLLSAEAILKRGLGENPASWELCNALGWLYYRHAQYASAEQLFKRATELTPDNPIGFGNLGGIYLFQGRYRDAEIFLTRAAAIYPTDQIYSNLGNAYFCQKQYGNAVEAFRKAVAIRPSNDNAWRGLGDSYEMLNDQRSATDAYTRALQAVEPRINLSPNDEDLLSRSALYWAKLGKKRDAEDALKKASRLSLNGPEFLFTSAVVHELTGERALAIAQIRLALRAGYSRSEIENSPELSHLRADERYSELAAAGPRPQHVIDTEQ